MSSIGVVQLNMLTLVATLIAIETGLIPGSFPFWPVLLVCLINIPLGWALDDYLGRPAGVM